MRLIALAAFAGLLVTAAHADAIRVQWRDTPFIVSDNDAHAIPVDDQNNTRLGWNSGQPGRPTLVVTYNAECVSQGAGSYVTITVLVDNRPASPTGAILCADTGGVPIAAVRMAYRHSNYTRLHHIQVIGTGVNTTQWQVSNTVLSVEQVNIY